MAYKSVEERVSFPLLPFVLIYAYPRNPSSNCTKKDFNLIE